MSALHVLAVVAGAAIVLGDVLDLVRALIVPRPTGGGPILVLARTLRSIYIRAAFLISDPGRRDSVLAVAEPVVLLWRLVLWMLAGLLGFGLVTWGVSHASFGHSLIAAGSSVTTLGIVTEPGTAPAVVDFLAAAFGLLVVALQIAYLPALYDAFNRRENLVTMLESRAGTPPWGPEILARHWLVGIQANLGDFYGQWERWSADVAESHSTYPALLWLRSPHRGNSWLVGLTAVIDSAALLLAFNPETAPTETRLCLRMGFTCLRDVARAVRIGFDADPRPGDPIELGYDEFLAAADRLRAAGVPLDRTPEEAWPHFKGWRVNYESLVHVLANLIVAPPAPWTGTRTRGDSERLPDRPVDRRPDKPEGDPPPSPWIRASAPQTGRAETETSTGV